MSSQDFEQMDPNNSRNFFIFHACEVQPQYSSEPVSLGGLLQRLWVYFLSQYVQLLRFNRGKVSRARQQDAKMGENGTFAVYLFLVFMFILMGLAAHMIAYTMSDMVRNQPLFRNWDNPARATRPIRLIINDNDARPNNVN